MSDQAYLIVWRIAGSNRPHSSTAPATSDGSSCTAATDRAGWRACRPPARRCSPCCRPTALSSSSSRWNASTSSIVPASRRVGEHVARSSPGSRRFCASSARVYSASSALARRTGSTISGCAVNTDEQRLRPLGELGGVGVRRADHPAEQPRRHDVGQVRHHVELVGSPIGAPPRRGRTSTSSRGARAQRLDAAGREPRADDPAQALVVRALGVGQRAAGLTPERADAELSEQRVDAGAERGVLEGGVARGVGDRATTRSGRATRPPRGRRSAYTAWGSARNSATSAAGRPASGRPSSTSGSGMQRS